MEKFIHQFLGQRWVLQSLFWINFFGTLYGYYWYRYQLAATPPPFLPFVPDSPTASLFFTIFLLLLLMGKKSSFIAAFALITQIKYGIWAVVAILWGGALGSPLIPEQYMLIISHSGMALEAILYYSFYRIKWVHLAVVSLWTLLNDWVDYTQEMHPWVTMELEVHHVELGWFTFSLSLFSIAVAAFLVRRQRKFSR
ncbi:DUF1405 domain-containing protein [Thermicanus aegyptius]|uniref:DUF1405 domain-containing protein n=1 Tax=Thermicanus aegyptius TaxID=94009 RepID=UPI0003F7D90A|nr:DUF1405 domain-containing protein [Thermicanus aegyptius]